MQNFKKNKILILLFFLLTKFSYGSFSQEDIPYKMRPELSSYSSNLMASKSIFNQNFLKRFSYDIEFSENVWFFSDSNEMAISDEFNQNITKLNTESNIAGLNFLNIKLSDSNFLMGGFISNISSKGKSERKFIKTDKDKERFSENWISGYSLGIYGSFFKRREEGIYYLDANFGKGMLKNKIKGNTLSSENYESSVLGGGFEIGGIFPLGEFFISPQYQLSLLTFKSDSFSEENGTKIVFKDDLALAHRFGIKLFSKYIKLNEFIYFRPFLEWNFVKTNKMQSLIMSGENFDVFNLNYNSLEFGLASNFYGDFMLTKSLEFKWNKNELTSKNVKFGFRYLF